MDDYAYGTDIVEEMELTLQEMLEFCRRFEEIERRASFYKSLGRNWKTAFLSDLCNDIPEHNREKAEQLKAMLEIAEMLTEDDSDIER